MDFRTACDYGMFAFILTMIGIGFTSTRKNIALGRVATVAWCLLTGTAIMGWTLWFFLHYGTH